VPYRDLEPISKQLTIVVGLTVVGFMAFGLALSFYRNVLFQETLLSIEGQNKNLRDQVRESQNELDYYRSAQYKDKFAKENIGRLNPGERVLLITQLTPPPGSVTAVTQEITEDQEAAFEEELRQIPVYLHWRLFLFERDKIEELKRSIEE
jgi:hypothetical protein